MVLNKIKKLSISKFRHLENIEIDIGDKITVITWPNWTGKSSILWLIGHVFTYKKIKGAIDDTPLETEYSEVFRFSKDKDYTKEYKWHIELDTGEIKEANSRYILGENRYRVDVGGRQKNEWKIKKPVYYLGLKRLFPLAQEKDKDLEIDLENNLLEDEKLLFERWYNQILSRNWTINTQHTRTKNKEFHAPTTEEYDALWNSSGQENIAQIILAILSFKRLKEQLWDSYEGWIILIDEIDATVYPRAQLKIIDIFLETARDYWIQFIFSTHSLDILGYMLKEKTRNFEHSSKIIFLDDSSGKIKKLEDEKSFEKMKAWLMHTAIIRNVIDEKINLYCEDEEAKIIIKWLLPPKIRKKIHFMKVCLWCNFYKELLRANVPEFLKSIIVFDWDARSEVKKKRYKVTFLPWSKRPENILLDFLNELNEGDKFWWNKAWDYSKRVFLSNKPTNTQHRDTMKNWFKSEIRYWWKDGKKLINRWMESNEESVTKFIKDIENFLKNEE